DSVYKEFRDRFVEEGSAYEVGPLISEGRLVRILAALEGAAVLAGGKRIDRAGWWLEPTVLEYVPADAYLSCTELFGPVAILYRVQSLDEAIALVNEIGRAHV